MKRCAQSTEQKSVNVVFWLNPKKSWTLELELPLDRVRGGGSTKGGRQRIEFGWFVTTTLPPRPAM